MWSLKNDEGPFLKVGSKAKNCEVFSRDPVLKFEGFGKRPVNFHPFPCALDGSTHHNKRQVLMCRYAVQLRTAAAGV